ncbi:MAG: hypothetical protein ABNH38_06370 [Tateyamaria sp.]|uniref:HalD/BesD family halogenase n=2 Tax=Tateyamaria sp. TaxID=1929288 RepID=UPI0032DDC188
MPTSPPMIQRSHPTIPDAGFSTDPTPLLRRTISYQMACCAPFSTAMDSMSSFENACPSQRIVFFRYADPLADVIVNAAAEGNGFPWHFDTNNFTVTLALQNADRGGAFEYAPMIRDSRNENFGEVSKVLDGTSDKVVSLQLEPGDLQLFKGRYSLHRVAPLEGETPRYVAIFSYVERPGMVGSVERTQQLYGKTLPIHHERSGNRGDALID